MILNSVWRCSSISVTKIMKDWIYTNYKTVFQRVFQNWYRSETGTPSLYITWASVLSSVCDVLCFCWLSDLDLWPARRRWTIVTTAFRSRSATAQDPFPWQHGSECVVSGPGQHTEVFLHCPWQTQQESRQGVLQQGRNQEGRTQEGPTHDAPHHRVWLRWADIIN